MGKGKEEKNFCRVLIDRWYNMEKFLMIMSCISRKSVTNEIFCSIQELRR